MKMLRWFRVGEPIPNGSKYLRSENKIVRYEEASHPQFDDIPIYEDFHLYEIPLEGDCVK